MCLSNRGFAISLLLLALPAISEAGGGYIVSVSGEADTANGRALAALVDWGITDDTWWSVALARTDTGGALGGLSTIYADTSIEHSFGAVGFRVGAAYWGDDDILDSADLRGGLFLRNDFGSISFNYERRAFDFVFRPVTDLNSTRTAEFDADGFGLSGFVNAGEKNSLFATFMTYEYSRDIRIQQDIDVLRFLSTSRLSLMNSLIDYRVSAGMNFAIGGSTLDVTLSTWQTAVDGGKVNSIALGLVAPSGPASDVEFRLMYDDSEFYGHTIGLAIGFYWFGA